MSAPRRPPPPIPRPGTDFILQGIDLSKMFIVVCFLIGQVQVVRAVYNYTAQQVRLPLVQSFPKFRCLVFEFFLSSISNSSALALFVNLQPDEISFDEGDILYIIDRVTLLYFPSNFKFAY